MTSEQITLFALFAIVFAALLWGRFRYDLVAFSALLAGVVLGVVPADRAFSGFGHSATLIVALVLIVSAGLVRSGAVQLITRTLIDAGASLGRHIALMGAVGGVLSAFMNNVAALALLMPVDIQTARKAGRAPGRSLMALSFATILGGMVTLIGTPPNIIIAQIRADTLGTPFAMFDFAPVGGAAALAGLAFVALIGWRLVPDRGDTSARTADLQDYVAELVVPEDSRLIGQTITDLRPQADSTDVALIGLIRGGRRLYGRAMTTRLRAGDALVLDATPEALDAFRAATGLDFTDSPRKAALEIESDGMVLAEVVVPEGARIAGRTAQSVGLAWRHRTVLMGISRRGRRIVQQMRTTRIEPGDILLLLAPHDTVTDVTAWLGGLPLADRGLQVTQDHKTWSAIALFGAAVAAASLGLIYLPIALGFVVVAYVVTGILSLDGLYDHVEWPVVVLLGSMIPLGAALDDAGGTALIAQSLVGLTQGWAPWAVLTTLMVVTMTLSDVLNNTATTIVAAPVGIEMARVLEVSPDPFLMAVAVAASAAFLTPIGHKNNTLILGPGGYRFSDYWRMGLPLEALIIAVTIPVILVVWPM